MYVTLEPCSHYGATSPCTSEIIKSNIGEVIYSIKDIDKRVYGKTYQILRSKKITTKNGLLKNKVSHFYIPYFYNRKNKLPYVTGKIVISKNNLIYSKNNKRITNKISDKFTHLLRYKNDSIIISYKTLNIDNPKLNCRLENMEKFSPIRIILDNKLDTNIKSYLFKTADETNTIIFYNEANSSKIFKFKSKKIQLIKSKIDKDKKFDAAVLMRKHYNLGCRNILIEGGNELTKSLLIKKIFNKFYLFKSPKKLSKLVIHKKFDGLSILKKNYKVKIKINLNFGKDAITLYRN
jgi:diaminohydroxyphosphoribosylaminopyrimidine deaminase/5-amino-6-(5-phosphoribosylamino)uracil reductase